MKLRHLAGWTPLHWLLVAVAGVCLLGGVATVGHGLGFRWDPFDLANRRADRAEADLNLAKADLGARSVEVAGARDTTRLVERAGADRAAAADVVNRYATQLETAPHEPIDHPDDGSDLRAIFAELCELRQSVCEYHPPAAAPGDAGDGPDAVSDPRSSR